MAVIRHGITRTVLLVGPWAIKLPTFRYGFRMWCRGVLANESEAEWSRVEGVCPVVRRFWFVNVYRRVERMLPENLMIDYRSLTPDWMPSGDHKPDNVGLLDGRWVWVDYDSSWNGPRCRFCHIEGRRGERA